MGSQARFGRGQFMKFRVRDRSKLVGLGQWAARARCLDDSNISVGQGGDVSVSTHVGGEVLEVALVSIRVVT